MGNPVCNFCYHLKSDHVYNMGLEDINIKHRCSRCGCLDFKQ
jgi:hypothetical protein